LFQDADAPGSAAQIIIRSYNMEIKCQICFLITGDIELCSCFERQMTENEYIEWMLGLQPLFAEFEVINEVD